MTHPNPYWSEHTVIECPTCGYRDDEAETATVCPECGGPVQNLAVARE